MNDIYLYGLIGYPLSHSFSQRYFTEKFANGGYGGYSYRNFPIGTIRELCDLLEQQPDLRGFNVTIPYKEQIIPFMDEMDGIAERIGAVNTVQVARNGKDVYLKGYNTDVYGFSRSLEEWFTARDAELPRQALVLGTGGASKAVACALFGLDIVIHTVSRKEGKDVYKTYGQLDADDMAAHTLIVNTTPLGMYPGIGEYPPIPYQYLTEKHSLYDLVYNPGETMFMRKGRNAGAAVHNGERMLHLQADKAWDIWLGNRTGGLRPRQVPLGTAYW
jgi:shikimate dehydrogenase